MQSSEENSHHKVNNKLPLSYYYYSLHKIVAWKPGLENGSEKNLGLKKT